MAMHEVLRRTDDSRVPTSGRCPRCSARLLSVVDIDNGRVQSCLMCGYQRTAASNTERGSQEAASAILDHILRARPYLKPAAGTHVGH